MKKLKFLAMALAAVVLPLGFASCGGGEEDEDDLWKGKLENPKYESDAALFNVTDDDSDIASIELTASGNYIVMPNDYDMPAPSLAPAPRKTTHKSIFRKSSTSRAGWEYGVFGEYKKLKEGVYELIGYGTLTIVNDSRINLALDNGSDLNLDVTKATEIQANALNNRLCRTWQITGGQYKVYDLEGNLIHTEKMTDREIKEECVEYVVMSKANTYITIDWDGEIEGYGVWNWEDKDLQVFNYHYTDEDFTGSVKVTFDGDRCKFYQRNYDYWGVDEEEAIVEVIISCKAK